MQIDKNSFHWRIYTWWYSHKYKGMVWVDDYHLEAVRAVPERSNLCPYMRAVMFWAPLRWFFCWGKVFRMPPMLWFIVCAVIAVPIVSHNHLLVLKVYGLVAGTLLFLFGVIAGMCRLAERYPEPPGSATLRKIKSSSFWALLRAYLRAAHDRVCPEVEPK